MYVEILQIIASSFHALWRQQAHYANGQMDRADRTDGFGRECGFAGAIVGGGYFGGEALEGGLELGARGWCDEGKEKEVS